MPLVQENKGASPSHLGVVLRAVRDMIAESGDGTPVMVGEFYATDPRSLGTPPCIVLVPEPGGGECEIAYAYELGRAGMQRHVCDVIVRAAEPGDDLGHLDNAYALSDKVYSAVKRATSGRFVPLSKPVGKYPSPFGVDTGAGTQISWGFVYERDIRADESIARVLPSAPDDATPTPFSPPGETGTLNTIDDSIEVVE